MSPALLLFLGAASATDYYGSYTVTTVDYVDNGGGYGYGGGGDYSGYQVITADVWSNDDEIAVLTMLQENPDFEQWTPVVIGQHTDILVPPGRSQMAIMLLDSQGVYATVKQDNLQTLIDHDLALEDLHRDEPLNPNALHPMSFDRWHGTSDFHEYFDYLEETYDFVTQETIGWSYEKREMKIVKICQGGCGHKYIMWIHAGIHGREWLAPSTAMYMVKELVEGDDDHPELTSMFDWYILPSANPDGYEFTRLKEDGDRMWRKTRRALTEEEKSKEEAKMALEFVPQWCVGTDPNRNWDYKWGEGSASTDPCDLQKYQGPEPFSEIEVKNMADFLLANDDLILFANSFHAYGAWLMLPWAYTKDEPADLNATKALFEPGRQAIKEMHGTEYKLDSTSKLVGTVGGSVVDWTFGATNIPYVMCIEMAEVNKTMFDPPVSAISQTGEDIFAFYVATAFELFNKHGYPALP